MGLIGDKMKGPVVNGEMALLRFKGAHAMLRSRGQARKGAGKEHQEVG
jgi:hypothetical protein